MHPITDRRFLVIYLGLWAFIIIAHFSLLYFIIGLDWVYSVADSILYNILFAMISLGIWYMVVYSGLNRQRSIESIASHISAAAFSIVIWIILGKFIEKVIFKTDIFVFNNEVLIRSFFGILYYGIMILLYSLIQNYNELKVKVQEKAELFSMLKEAELNVLKAQIKPHFLFNSLNSISALTMTDASKAHEMIIKLSEFMRYSLQNNSEQLTTLENELYHIGLYLDIEKVRFADKLEISINVGPKCLQLELPNLILQPLAENAIKYGVYESTETVQLSIECEASEGYLITKIKNEFDNFVTHQKGTGTGLKNVKERLSLIYGRKDIVDISEKNGIFEVVLKIPQYE